MQRPQGRAVQAPRMRDVVVGAAFAAVLIGVAPDDGNTQSGPLEARQLASPAQRFPSRGKQRCQKERSDRCKPWIFSPARLRHANLRSSGPELIAEGLAEYAESQKRIRAFLTPQKLDIRV